MYLTLKQVCDTLSGSSTGAYASTSLVRDVNKAIQGLSGLSGWECLRRTVRFFSAGPVFALPQGYAGLVRVCLNGRPATVRGQDFRFLQSGPGDLRRVPKGFVPVSTQNVADIGTSPVISEPVRPFRLFAFTDAALGEKPEPALVVSGLRPDGRTVRVELPLNHYEEDDGHGEPVPGTVDVAEAEPSDVVFSRISDVVVQDGTTDYVTLYAVSDAGDLDVRRQIACYNPKVPVPRFRRYELDGVPEGAPVELLVEARIDPVPLVRDTDVVPFESPVEPIEWMIRADWAMKAGEATQAQTYRTQAMNWLKAREITDDTVQTQVVVNSVYRGSMGEISEEADNI